MGGYDEAVQNRRKYKRIAHAARRDAAIEAYGGKCSRCGDRDRDQLELHNRWNRYWAKALLGRTVRGGEDKFRALELLGYPQDRGFELLCPECRVGAAQSPGRRPPTTGGCPNDTTRV